MNIRQKVAWFNVAVIPLGLIAYSLLLKYCEWRVARIALLPAVLLVAAAQIKELLYLHAARKRKQVVEDERERVFILRAAVIALWAVCLAMVIAANIPYNFIDENLVITSAILKRIMLMVPVYGFLLGYFVYSTVIIVLYGKE